MVEDAAQDLGEEAYEVEKVVEEVAAHMKMGLKYHK